MHTHAVRAIVATAAVLLACGGLTACGQRPERYDDSACQYALRNPDDGETGKPDACKDMKEDDYTALVRSVAAENEDMDKLLKDLEDAGN